MTWSNWYAIRSYVRSTHWLVPLIAVILEQITLRAALTLETSMTWLPDWPFGPSGTQGAMQTIIALDTAFLVFTFGSMLVAIQIAGGQLTPRIITTTLLRDNVIRLTSGLFIFSLVFCIGLISRIEDRIPLVAVWIAAGTGVASLVGFLFLIDHAARFLRPVSIVARVADMGFRVIETVYPDYLHVASERSSARPELGAPSQIVRHTDASSVVVAAHVPDIVSEARRVGGVIVVAAQIGDFVATDQPLFQIHGGTEAADEHRLRGSIAFGIERTIEQDPTFAFRVIVDIGIKALSKAINDPTTAVLTLDQLQRLLQEVGRRNLHNECIVDESGTIRVIFPTPNWDDFVHLTCREIRIYGAKSLQVARRMRAMIEALISTLPELRRPALRLELDLLDRAIGTHYEMEEDRRLAGIADPQGLGGASLPAKQVEASPAAPHPADKRRIQS